MLWQVRQSNGETFNTPTTDASCGGRPELMRALAPSVPWQPAQLASSPLSKASPVPCTEVSLNCASLEKIRVVSLWHSVQDRSAAAGAAPAGPAGPCGPAGPAGPAAPAGPPPPAHALSP